MRHFLLGGILGHLTILILIWALNSFSNSASDIFLSMNARQISEKRLVMDSKNDYEIKLIELQTRLDEAQRKLDQLDALRFQLLRKLYGRIPHAS